MNETYPNPWDFCNENQQLTSPDSRYKIVYEDLCEIAMGAPLGGKCFIENNQIEKLFLNKFCGGPAFWETNGKKVAIPVWCRTFFFGTIQNIGVFDIETKRLKIFSKRFNVLDLRSFDGNKIFGYDSPNYKPKIVEFNIEKEKVKEIILLK